jgi:hypothetical protein
MNQMEYYDEYDSPQCDENWEFNQIINSLIDKEVNIRTEQVQTNLNTYIAKCNKSELEIIGKNKTIKELSNNIETLKNTNIIFNEIVGNLNKDNIEEFINVIYKQDFNESGNIPIWFRLIVNYYSHKDKIISFLRYCKIDVPKKVETFRLPFDWNKEELNVFFNNMRNHYCCNGCIYENNLEFWYREGYWDKPIDNCKHSYSEIPWQFILRNPLLNTKEYCDKMADAINEGNHGVYFYKILDYQNLDEDNLKLLINNIDLTKIKKSSNDMFQNLILKNIKILNEEKYEIIYPLVFKVWRELDYIIQMPKKYLVRYLHEKGIDAKEIIFKLKVLTKEEKMEIQNESFKTGWSLILFGLGLVVVHIVYLLYAINLDPLKYPTIIMIAWIMISFIKGAVSKKLDLSTEEKRKEYLAKIYLSKRTLSGTIINLAFLGYFVYMFYLLVLI